MATFVETQESYEVYFEAQDAESALCGRHAINNLLQGAYFTSIDLGNIGAQLDAQEQQLLFDEKMDDSRNVHLRPQAANVSNNKYSNVSLEGYFSVDVLITALKQLQIDALPLSHPECAAANVG